MSSTHKRARPFLARRISSRYGWRITPGRTVRTFHKGEDYAVPGGSVVQVTEPGDVADVRESRRSGKTVTVFHDDGWVTKYHHLRTATVRVGDRLDAGGIVGLVGHTGTAAHGDHLHLETWQHGVHLDPAVYFQYTPPTPEET